MTLRPILEALLVVTEDPVPAAVLARITGHPEAEVQRELADLAASYGAEQRGFALRCVAGGWRLYSHPDHAALVQAFLVDGQHATLSQAALETLTVIAYRQPVTRGRISAIRGVNVDGVVRTLTLRGLVTQSGTDEGSGAATFRTTPLFLERLGIDSLEALPSLAPLVPDPLERDPLERDPLDGGPLEGDPLRLSEGLSEG